MACKLSITKFLFLDLHTELTFVPRIMHVHGELGGNLGVRLNFLIAEDNKQAVSWQSSDCMCIINGSATGQSQVCMRILIQKRGFQASCVYINQEGYPGLHVSIQIAMFMGISDLK